MKLKRLIEQKINHMNNMYIYHYSYKMFLCWQLHVASSVPETHFDAAQRKRPELHRGVRAGRLQTQSLPQVQVHRLSGTKEIHYL